MQGPLLVAPAPGVLAVEAGEDATQARLAPEMEQVPELLPAIAELVVFL
ncbi:hypothetical protein GTY41_20260 [Streptomyces sp. SID685]|nr:hypothetical protein [Streptomyces sp. SID685]MYR87207.1 hypothetical protein [Streptomyces sp. SID685]